MAKRKSIGEATEEPLRRSTRQKTSGAEAAATVKKSEPSKPKPNETKKGSTTKKSVPNTDEKTEPAKKRQRASKAVKSEQKDDETGANEEKSAVKTDNDASAGGRQYWLLKAEPETRLEGGVDVKFSIDDLAAKTEPEPWDGIRNYVARNNLRAMKKGDLAFFYHSNCKEPGIVGTMEIVEEHSPDMTAQDPKAPYYDPKDTKKDDPKWSVVHVEFRSKFDVQIGLKELKELCAPGKPLENMQMLKQTRLSVSKVSADEWRYINDWAERKAQEAKS